MSTQHTFLALGVVSLLFTGSARAARHPRDPRPADPQQQQQQGQEPQAQARGALHVDLVIALDTSGSMDGLIDTVRKKLWDVVNVLGKARPRPILRVGLISYGNDGYDAKVGWVRKDSDLTTDLDGVYAKLFALSTNGGTEYVARAVTDATTTMRWSRDPRALRILFVAGNEPATQDPQIPIEKALHAARAHKIFVNTIYCGTEQSSEAAGWRTVARLGAGRYAAIDQNHAVAIATPMDRKLAQLSDELNSTYIAYGRDGLAKKKQQIAQDRNADSAGAPAAAARAEAKSSGLYRNDKWDLVDARARGMNVAAAPAAELPEPMRAMAPTERRAYVDGKAKQRAKIQAEIGELSRHREAYLRAAREKRAGGPGFDDAVTGAIKAEARSVGFRF